MNLSCNFLISFIVFNFRIEKKPFSKNHFHISEGPTVELRTRHCAAQLTAHFASHGPNHSSSNHTNRKRLWYGLTVKPFGMMYEESMKILDMQMTISTRSTLDFEMRVLETSLRVNLRLRELNNGKCVRNNRDETWSNSARQTWKWLEHSSVVLAAKRRYVA